MSFGWMTGTFTMTTRVSPWNSGKALRLLALWY